MCYGCELNVKNHPVDDAVYLPGGIEEVIAEFFTEAFQGPFLCLEAKTKEYMFKSSLSTVNDTCTYAKISIWARFLVRLIF